MICPERITGGGERASPLSANYVLSYHDRKLAVIEAKRTGLGHTDGVGQAKDYARRLQARFAWSTNGIGWYGIDMATGAEGDHALLFPSPQELWQRCFPEGNDWRDRFGTVPFETGARPAAGAQPSAATSTATPTGSQRRPTPLPLTSSWPGLASSGQLSTASRAPSPSKSPLA